MPTGTIEKTVKLAGISAATRATRTATGQISHVVSLPAGKAGTLTTRTDDDTGIITVASGHEITDSDYVNVFWAEGVRYGMAVTATTDTTVSVNVGAGDVLPALDYAVVVTKRVEIDTDFDGDLVKMIIASTDQRAHLEFLTGADVSIRAQELVDLEGWDWVSDQDVDNPLTGDPVGKIQATCGVSTANTSLTVGVLYDSAS